jgi:hypothetical protein
MDLAPASANWKPAPRLAARFLQPRPCSRAGFGRSSEAGIVSALDLVQWPAMVVTVIASWYVASSRRERRQTGFWVFLVSNVLWVVWGVHAHAYALIVLQLCLAAMNIRGELRNT